MTVSRALRPGTPVSPAVRAKIEKLAAKLGYKPDPQLTALISYKLRIRPKSEQSVIGYLTTDENRLAYQRIPIAREAFNGAIVRGSELGYRVEHIWINDLRKRHRDPSAVLRARGVRGLLLARQPQVNARIGLDWSEFSCVAIGYSFREIVFHTVASHLFQVVTLAFDRALAMGYTRPAIILTKELHERSQHQYCGAFLSRQETLPPENRLPVLWTSNTVNKIDLWHFIEKHKPDVLMYTWMEALPAIKALRLQIPQEIGFIDLNLSDQALARGATGVFQNFSLIGRTAINRLNMLLHLNERGAPETPEISAVYGTWVDGKTSRS
jgi:LacI family transcriptional regulator